MKKKTNFQNIHILLLFFSPFRAGENTFQNQHVSQNSQKEKNQYTMNRSCKQLGNLHYHTDNLMILSLILIGSLKIDFYHHLIFHSFCNYIHFINQQGLQLLICQTSSMGFQQTIEDCSSTMNQYLLQHFSLCYWQREGFFTK